MDALDIWMMESIKLYSELLMFNLQQPTSVIEWMPSDAICVAGCSGISVNEIVELGLPAKLLTDPDAGGIHKERDFDVRCGGLCNHAVQRLQSFPEERLIATSSTERSNVTIYNVGHVGTDLIQEVSTIPLTSGASAGTLSMERRPSQGPHLAVAKTCSDLCITDIISQQTIYEGEGSNEELCGVKFFDTNTLIVSTNTRGSFQIVDVREKSKMICAQRENGVCTVSKRDTENKIIESESISNLGDRYVKHSNISTNDVNKSKVLAPTVEQSGLNFRFDIACSRDGCTDSKHPIVQFDASGHLKLMDLRNLTTACKSWKLGALSTRSSPYLEVKFDPNQSEVISVSGFDNRVYIFDVKNADTGVDLKPMFVHHSHMNSDLVLTHTWHPTLRNFVLSSDNEGALHAWKWNRQTF